MAIQVAIMLDGDELVITLIPVMHPKTGDKVHLADPKHVNFTHQIRYDIDNSSHVLYAKRGLLFPSSTQAFLKAKGMLGSKMRLDFIN